ncbi:MAG TPA: chromate efflux transporter [Candidatus Limnocylindrales bacterium]|jgi:chromate transporter|nr:chromate efflux transporter [Candidatus Limnocylindrales bacterium]
MRFVNSARRRENDVEEGRPGLPTFREAFLFWLKLGFISFGGPTGQIAMMHQELVERRKWISEARFLHALNYCMLLPGPEAQQLATYVGWLLHRTRGGIAAGALFVLPSVFVLWTLSSVYVVFGKIAWVAALFYGLKPAVLAIVVSAVIRIGSKALKNEVMWSLAALAFVSIFFLKVPFPIIIVAAGLIGLAGGKMWPAKFLVAKEHGGKGATTVIADNEESAQHTKPSLVRAVKVCAVCLALWWAPVVLVGAWLGWNHTVFREGVFFSKAAMVTFGGAYAVLPYVSQQAVEQFGWLNAGQMLDGLGLAETTPGPLIMVLQFVGFMGGWQHPGQLSPLLAGTLGALVTTWTTFVPCFLWIFLGGPHIEQLRGNAKLTAALSAVTAAVVGVVLNLAVWFGLHVLFPARGQVDWFTVVVGAVAFAGMVKWKWDVVPVVLGGALLGLIYKMVL